MSSPVSPNKAPAQPSIDPFSKTENYSITDAKIGMISPLFTGGGIEGPVGGIIGAPIVLPHSIESKAFNPVKSGNDLPEQGPTDETINTPENAEQKNEEEEQQVKEEIVHNFQANEILKNAQVTKQEIINPFANSEWRDDVLILNPGNEFGSTEPGILIQNTIGNRSGGLYTAKILATLHGKTRLSTLCVRKINPHLLILISISLTFPSFSQDSCYLNTILLSKESKTLIDLSTPMISSDSQVLEIELMSFAPLNPFSEMIKENAQLVNKFSKIVVEAYGLRRYPDIFQACDVINLINLFDDLEKPFIDNKDLASDPAYESLRNCISVSRELLNFIPTYRVLKSGRSTK